MQFHEKITFWTVKQQKFREKNNHFTLFLYRIAVVHFPYSDSETIPTILPIHIRNDPSKLPEDFNALLCQLLEVRKRELFSFIPIPIVRPKVSHAFKICKNYGFLNM